MVQSVDPLPRNTPIIVKSGAPSQFFMRQWQSLLSLVRSVVALNQRTITAGTGLSGGGDLSADRTIDLENTAVTPGTYGDVANAPQFTVDAQGRITAASENPMASTLNSLLDVDTSGVADGNVIYYDSVSGTWLAAAPGVPVNVGTLWYDMTAGMTGISLHRDGRTITGLYTASARRAIKATLSKSTGKHYFEILVRIASSHFPLSGVGESGSTVLDFVGKEATSWGMGCAGTAFTNNTGSGGLNTLTTNDVLGVAVDFTAATGSVKFYKNNSLEITYGSLTLNPMFPMTSVEGLNNNDSCTLRTKAAQCTYLPPAGYSNWDT